MAEEEPKQLGRYEIVRVLGKGAMGVVYEGKDPNIGRRVAIKTARRDVLEASGRADEMMERFLREARSAGGLNHPNIITIYDADEQDGMAYIAMEFLEGGDLEEHLIKHKYMEQEEAVEICATIASALAFAHQDGIVHRDIKPANIIMTDKGIKVADFGIAHMSDSNLTQEGAMIGTPHYMSPEQFQGRKVDGRSDLFSLAVMLYEMLTGEKPFTGEQLSTVMTAVIKLDPVEPSELNSMVDDALSTVVMKALSKNPGKRYADGDAFAAALRESLKSAPSQEVTQAATDLGATIATPPATVGVGATIATGPPPPVEAAPSSPEEDTVRGAPPELEDSDIKAPDTEKERAVAEPKRKFAIATIVGACVAAFAVSAAVAVFLVGAPENNWAPQGTVQVRLINNVEQYDAWERDNKNFPDGATEPTDATVQIKSGDSPFVFNGPVIDGKAYAFTIPPEQQTEERWQYVGTHVGYKKLESSYVDSPEKPDDKLAIRIGLIKNGVMEEALGITE